MIVKMMYCITEAINGSRHLQIEVLTHPNSKRGNGCLEDIEMVLVRNHLDLGAITRCLRGGHDVGPQSHSRCI